MSYIANVKELVRKRNPAEWEFHQAVEEVSTPSSRSLPVIPSIRRTAFWSASSSRSAS